MDNVLSKEETRLIMEALSAMKTIAPDEDKAKQIEDLMMKIMMTMIG